MATRTQIEERIKNLGSAKFQEFCDKLICREENGVLVSLGKQDGRNNTTKGSPDSYIRKDNGHYIFMEYTMHERNLYNKIESDICKCFDHKLTNLDAEFIDKIIYCHTSSNINSGDDNKLYDLCKDHGVKLAIYGINKLADRVERYPTLIRDYLGLNISTYQIFSIKDFIELNSNNEMSAPLDTKFQFREEKKNEIITKIKSNTLVIITGKAGVGKTRTSLEAISDKTFENYHVLCIKSNGLDFYDDLMCSMEMHGKYIIFVDDANEIENLSPIFQQSERDKNKYDIKIVITVRDYAKENVLDFASQHYEKLKKVVISPFSDDEIKTFVKTNLNIRNPLYLNKIVEIAEGNPRMAYMAGKLAREKQNLLAISNATELYSSYYRKYITCTIGRNRELCITAGILAMINVIHLTNNKFLQELLEPDFVNITVEEFKENILALNQMEVVEIYDHEVAKISDQCFSNYMLYFVFVEKKYIELSKALEVCYPYNPLQVSGSISTLLNIFYSKNTIAFCEDSVRTVWDKYERNNSQYFNDFARYFHVMNPEKGFEVAYDIINEIESKKFDPFNVNLKINTKYHNDRNVLDYLTNFRSIDQLNIVLQLLLEYCSRSPDCLIEGIKWLKDSYGIEQYSIDMCFALQIDITDFLSKKIEEGNKFAMVIAVQWCIYSLQFQFYSVSPGRKNTIVINSGINISGCKGAKEYRDGSWNLLISLSKYEELNNQIISFLIDYSFQIAVEGNLTVILEDRYKVKLLVDSLTSKQMSLLFVMQKLKVAYDNINVDFKLQNKHGFNEFYYELVDTLDYDYFDDSEDYEEKHKTKIIRFASHLEEDEIVTFVVAMNELIEYSVINSNILPDMFYEDLCVMIDCFDTNRLTVLMNAIVNYGSEFNLSPLYILKPLINDNSEWLKLFNYLKERDFPQKSRWIYTLFELLDENSITEQNIKELIEFFNDEFNNHHKVDNFRDLKVLEKFRRFDPNIYVNVCSIIFNRRSENDVLARSYLRLLFDNRIYSFDDLKAVFAKNLALLENIFFYIVECGYDIVGDYFLNFIKLNPNCLQRYEKLLWKIENRDIILDYKIRDHIYKLALSLWKSDDFIDYFDTLFIYFIMKNNYVTIDVFRAFLDMDDSFKENQIEWLKHSIELYAKNEYIYALFNVICDLSEDIRWKAVKKFIECNGDIESFKRLNILPNSFSNSFAKYYKQCIKFIESLFPLLSDIKYIKHKSYLASIINEYQKKVRVEEQKEYELSR